MDSDRDLELLAAKWRNGDQAAGHQFLDLVSALITLFLGRFQTIQPADRDPIANTALHQVAKKFQAKENVGNNSEQNTEIIRGLVFRIVTRTVFRFFRDNQRYRKRLSFLGGSVIEPESPHQPEQATVLWDAISEIRKELSSEEQLVLDYLALGHNQVWIAEKLEVPEWRISKIKRAIRLKGRKYFPEFRPEETQ